MHILYIELGCYKISRGYFTRQISVKEKPLFPSDLFWLHIPIFLHFQGVRMYTHRKILGKSFLCKSFRK